MFAPETIAFVEGGTALIIGTVGADGLPHASRGWGLTVVAREAGEIRLLLDAAEAQTPANLVATGAIAVTATDVPTLRSLQMKGSCSEVAPATDLDADRSDRYREAFFTQIETTERTPRDLLERLAPKALVACTVRVTELFDQTPGPGAGTPMPAGDPA
jgi:Pyridoxamine 5'-phosphate oxidase